MERNQDGMGTEMEWNGAGPSWGEGPEARAAITSQGPGVTATAQGPGVIIPKIPKIPKTF